MLHAGQIPVNLVLSLQLPFAIARNDIGQVLPQFIETWPGSLRRWSALSQSFRQACGGPETALRYLQTRKMADDEEQGQPRWETRQRAPDTGGA